MNLRDRIREVRLANELSFSKFGLRIGETKDKIYSMETGRQKVPSEVLKKIVVEFTINAHWLLTGEGEMYGINNEKGKFPLVATPQMQSNIIKDHRKARMLAFIDYWFSEESPDDQVWLEMQLGRSIPEYKTFVSSKDDKSS
jgi:transcriptional regulator with XRE-family HTH domain